MNALMQLRTKTQARWAAMSSREQRGFSMLGALLGVLVFGSIAITPALNTLRDSENQRANMAQQQAQMLALQTQAQWLQTRTPLSHDEALRQLQSITPSAQIQLNVQAGRVTAQLKAVPAATLANWIAQARSQAQALPIEAHLTRNNASATVTWDGSLVLNLPHRGSAANE